MFCPKMTLVWTSAISRSRYSFSKSMRSEKIFLTILQDSDFPSEENQMSANLILKMHPLVSLRAKFGTKYDELNLNLRHAIEERL